MEFRIQHKGIKALTEHINSDEKYKQMWEKVFQPVENGEVTELEVCDYLGHALDSNLERNFETFVCLNNLSYGQNSDWVIIDRGVLELTHYLNNQFENARGVDILIDCFGDFESLLPSDICIYFQTVLDKNLRNLFGWSDLSMYTSWTGADHV